MVPSMFLRIGFVAVSAIWKANGHVDNENASNDHRFYLPVGSHDGASLLRGLSSVGASTPDGFGTFPLDALHCSRCSFHAGQNESNALSNNNNSPHPGNLANGGGVDLSEFGTTGSCYENCLFERWPKQTEGELYYEIPYKFHGKWAEEDKEKVLRGMRYLESGGVPIKFASVAADSGGGKSFLEITQDGSGKCWSNIGAKYNVVKRQLNFGSAKCFGAPHLLRNLLHVLGLHFHHQRPGAERHITVLISGKNVTTDIQFEPSNSMTDLLEFPFDAASIMLGGGQSFESARDVVVEALYPGFKPLVDYPRSFPSDCDWAQLRKLYPAARPSSNGVAAETDYRGRDEDRSSSSWSGGGDNTAGEAIIPHCRPNVLPRAAVPTYKCPYWFDKQPGACEAACVYDFAYFHSKGLCKLADDDEEPIPPYDEAGPAVDDDTFGLIDGSISRMHKYIESCATWRCIFHLCCGAF